MAPAALAQVGQLQSASEVTAGTVAYAQSRTLLHSPAASCASGSSVGLPFLRPLAPAGSSSLAQANSRTAKNKGLCHLQRGGCVAWFLVTAPSMNNMRSSVPSPPIELVARGQNE